MSELSTPAPTALDATANVFSAHLPPRIAAMVGLVALADVLFFNQVVGWTAGGFTLCVLLVAAFFQRHLPRQ